MVNTRQLEEIKLNHRPIYNEQNEFDDIDFTESHLSEDIYGDHTICCGHKNGP